jgi:hypothetical protein
MIGGACRSTFHRVLKQSGGLLNQQLKGSDQTTIGEQAQPLAMTGHPSEPLDLHRRERRRRPADCNLNVNYLK